MPLKKAGLRRWPAGKIDPAVVARVTDLIVDEPALAAKRSSSPPMA